MNLGLCRACAGPVECVNVLWLLVSAFIVLADQATKHVVSRLVAPYEVVPCLGGIVRITNVRNSGAAFGVLHNGRPMLIAIAVVVTLAGAYYLLRWPRRWWVQRLGVSLGLGGTIGNLIDRVMVGSVFDFIDLGIWPVFNLADSAIVIGMALILYSVLFHPSVKEE